jgi:hypothetical protein
VYTQDGVARYSPGTDAVAYTRSEDHTCPRDELTACTQSDVGSRTIFRLLKYVCVVMSA